MVWTTEFIDMGDKRPTGNFKMTEQVCTENTKTQKEAQTQCDSLYGLR